MDPKIYQGLAAQAAAVLPVLIIPEMIKPGNVLF